MTRYDRFQGADQRGDLMMAALILFIALSIILGSANGFGATSMPREAIEKYFFTETADTYMVGDRIYRWENDVHVLGQFGSVEDPLTAVVAAIAHSAALRDLKIDLRVPDTLEGYAERVVDGPSNFLVMAGEDFAFALSFGPLRGFEKYWEHAKRTGCLAVGAVPYGDERDYLLYGAKVAVRDTSDPEVMEDCLFRGLLLGLGIHYTPEFAFRTEPLSAAEREEALDALALLYHPKVEPGMAREQFFAVLAAEGLLED